MYIVEDTRQQAGKHKTKHDWWQKNGDELIRCKLPFGDYAIPPAVSVDTKANLTEIATNMCGSYKEQKRFKDECIRARQYGCMLVFLVECGLKSRDDLYGTTIMLGNGREIKGDQLAMAMSTMESRYGCKFEFAKPSEAARRVNEILNERQ